MEYYKSKDQERGKVTAYVNESGRMINVDVVNGVVAIPDDAKEDLLKKVKTWKKASKKDYDKAVKQAGKEPEEDQEEEEEEKPEYKVEDLPKMSYKELQGLAKAYDIDATQSADELKKALGWEEEEDESEDDGKEA